MLQQVVVRVGGVGDDSYLVRAPKQLVSDWSDGVAEGGLVGRLSLGILFTLRTKHIYIYICLHALLSSDLGHTRVYAIKHTR